MTAVSRAGCISFSIVYIISLGIYYLPFLLIGLSSPAVVVVGLWFIPFVADFCLPRRDQWGLVMVEGSANPLLSTTRWVSSSYLWNSTMLELR